MLDRLPGRTIRKDFRKRAIPPLWMWLRSAFYIAVGSMLIHFGLAGYGKILITLAMVQLVGTVLAIFFQEVAKGINRFRGIKKK